MKSTRYGAVGIALIVLTLWAGGLPARAHARSASILTLSSASTSSKMYTRILLTAQLKNKAGHVLANRQVRLVSRPATGTSWSVESTKTTNSSGKTYWRVQEKDSRVYRLRYMGSTKYLPDTSRDKKITGHGLTQMFAEEFSGSAVDTSTWKPTMIWGDVAPDKFWQRYRPDSLETSAGKLTITATPSVDATYPYTSGAITSSGTVGYRFRYGYVETRAKVPEGQGLWSAIWLHSPDIASWDEIDVLEIRGQLPKWNVMSLHYMTGGKHFQVGEHYKGDNLADDYHTFAIDWSPNRVIWYRDGVERFRVTDRAKITDAEMLIVANLQLAKGGWGGSPDSTTQFPARLMIDYIRVYQRL